jgi:hypothetical protein
MKKTKLILGALALMLLLFASYKLVMYILPFLLLGTVGYFGWKFFKK